ncbi:kinesin-4-like [Canna indica]|uniref:Kinesin-4-like n=1 Tax=Canna indica TaxID=4628 RepID=A0AAQ3QC91_9LILI|nr:kinesin-4-like [Canna indica]
MKLEAFLEMPNSGSPVDRRGQNWERQGMAARVNIDAKLAKKQREVIEWLNSLFPGLSLPLEASEEELRARLFDGTVLCGIMKKFSPGYITERRNGNFLPTGVNRLQNIRMFVSAVEQMGLPAFKVSDLEQGPLSAVVNCLLLLKDHLLGEGTGVGTPDTNVAEARVMPKDFESTSFDSLEVLMGDSISDGKNSGILEEERRKVMQLYIKPTHYFHFYVDPSTPQSHHGGRRFHEVFQLKQESYFGLTTAKISEMIKSNSLDNASTQSLLSIANGILDESAGKKNGDIPQLVACLLRKVVQEIERRIASQAEHIRKQNNIIKAREEKYLSRIRVLEALATGTSEETETEKYRIEERNKIVTEAMSRLMKEKEKNDTIISELKQELEIQKMTIEETFQHMEAKAKEYQMELEQKLGDTESLLAESQSKVKKLQSVSESKFQIWNQKEHVLQRFFDLQLQSVQDLWLSSDSIKHEVKSIQNKWCEEITNFGKQLKVLTDAAENYHSVLEENRKLYNEVQELKGNIRVYCRIRPFLPEENERQTTIEYIGENGELVIMNPAKQGKDWHKMFKFNKIFGPDSTQEEVFLDTQPLVRSVLDGYNVCIFAYGQTGSGKTYTMSGPNSGNEKEWGVNYRALNDLFHLSRKRKDTYIYEVGVQMVEIYNEQVRDLLTYDGSVKKYPFLHILFHSLDNTLGILSTSQPNGLAVPDAAMHPVKSTDDVLELMQIGHSNRAVGATALNERSSRSHSIMTVHVRGVDVKTGAPLRGSLHLVDLAGSERVDRSEVTGDRLKEAQHINKSLSALGDVIYSLSQKSAHVPYRNSKLTQVLQSSLGGHAKTLMLVQINPHTESYSETLSTLKFAERVSGVELGAAKSQKEGKDIRDLLEQIGSLKDIIARKDEEIEQLQQLKDTRLRHSNSLRHSSSSPDGKVVEHNGERSESDFQQSIDDIEHQKECQVHADSEERLSDVSSVLGMEAETDGLIAELIVSPRLLRSSEITKGKVPKTPARVPKPPLQKPGLLSPSIAKLRDPIKSPRARAARFTLANNCQHTVWPGALSGAGTAPLSTTGFVLQKGETRTVDAPAAWSGRFWGRTLCAADSSGKFSCGTGDCGSGSVECSGGGAAPPATLAEFTLNGSGGMDFYDVSLVDGYNLPMLVVPQGGAGNCSATGCLADLNGLCPTDLKVVLSTSDGGSESVACKSACEAFGSPQYCCSGEYGNPSTCKPSSYSQFFKNACPRAYSYAYDDASSTFTCAAGGDYLITFCPSTTSQKSSDSNPDASLSPTNSTMIYTGGETSAASRMAALLFPFSVAVFASYLIGF